ncbi:MAG: nicotinate phosphoribosyltransferase [Planctomycetota bacterium]|nr:MAG: nicotinate phosphoribosyltransferase [Planctomycetota bacterium]
MGCLAPLYGMPLGLLTDLYQLTMAYGYWKTGMREHRAVFHLFFRKPPFGGAYALAGGIEAAAEWLDGLRFTPDDLSYLAGLRGNDGRPLFPDAFLSELQEFRFRGDVDAVREGTAVFAHEPLIRVTASIIEAQLLETALLTLVNFGTLITTKAARICEAAEGDAVVEFGLRRAQGIDGGVTAARAAYVGGCVGTSNVLAGRLFGIPVKGTHAHSWVMAFGDEQTAFDRYAEAMPNNAILLVDTYDTVRGVEHAIATARRLRAGGHRIVGIRLDSGDIAALSRIAREKLDAAGFHEAVIVASGDLDEFRIAEFKRRGARVDVWGVGTRLAVAWDQPALGGVYKLGGIRPPGQAWSFRMKRSDDPAKTTNPGILQVRRFGTGGRMLADVLYNEPQHTADWRCVSPDGSEPPISLAQAEDHGDLLQPLFRDGQRVRAPLPIEEIRRFALQQREAIPQSVRRIEQPAEFPVMLDQELFRLKTELLRRIEAAASGGAG